MTSTRSPVTGHHYEARVSALLSRLGSDLTEQDFADLALACADQAGLPLSAQTQLLDALNARPRRRTLSLVPPTDVNQHHRYLAAFDAVDALGADLVLVERRYPGAPEALTAWAYANNRQIEQREADGWSGVLRVVLARGSVNEHSIDVYLT